MNDESPAPASSFTRAETEAGRKLFAGDWQFAWAAGSVEALPPMRGVEIAFAGRSNVGKSSLINALTGRRALARTSHTPGRTQELIFFTAPSKLTLVDMPGYGYAAAAKTKIKAWTTLIHAFLMGRANLARVYLLIDARHGLKPIDDTVLATLDKAAVNYQVVLTKTDEVKPADLPSPGGCDQGGARQAPRRLSRGGADLVAHRCRHRRTARGDRTPAQGARRGLGVSRIPDTICGCGMGKIDSHLSGTCAKRRSDIGAAALRRPFERSPR